MSQRFIAVVKVVPVILQGEVMSQGFDIFLLWFVSDPQLKDPKVASRNEQLTQRRQHAAEHEACAILTVWVEEKVHMLHVTMLSQIVFVILLHLLSDALHVCLTSNSTTVLAYCHVFVWTAESSLSKNPRLKQ